MSIDHQALIERLADVMSRNDWDRLPDVLASDAVLEFPQSGEVFRGVANIRAQYENYPGGLAEGRIAVADLVPSEPAYALTPTYTLVTVEGSGNRGTAVFRTRYPDDSRWWTVTLYETNGDHISRSRVFFAQEFEAPGWREPFREAHGRDSS